MMKKTLAIFLSLALILSLCGTFAGALASEVENGIRRESVKLQTA